MIDIEKYEGHPPAPWGWRHKIAVWKLTANGDKEWIDVQVNEDTDPTVMALIADAPLLKEEVKRLQYLERYAPTFQVFAQNEEDMEEEYTQHGSLKECEEYIAALEDGWIGRIEVIEDFVLTNNPQIKTIEEWRNEE